MSDDPGAFPWTEEQWSRARKVVQESARRARVASSFLPLYGPLAASQVTVNAMRMKGPGDDVDDIPEGGGQHDHRLEVIDDETIALTTISADIYLRTYEAEDPEMTAAISMIGRASDVLGRLEDAIIFNGQPGRHQAPVMPPAPTIWKVRGGQQRPGLLQIPGGSQHDQRWDNPIEVPGVGDEQRGAALVTATVCAITNLEAQGHCGPFAMVLGTQLYLAANTPNVNSMVLPSDRILPFLDGPLLRSSTIPDDQGVLLALAGEPVDLVVAHDLELKYVQMTVEPRYVLRLSERFTLRIKQQRSVCVLQAVNEPDGNGS